MIACQMPLSMGFPRQEYWRGLPFPLPGIFLTLGSNPLLLQTLYHWANREAPLKSQSGCKIPIVISIEKLCDIFSYQRAKQNIRTSESSAVPPSRSSVAGKEPGPACHVLPSCTPKLPPPKHLLFSSLELNLQTSLFSRSFLHLSAALSHFTHVWLCDPLQCSPPDSCVHRILQARILEWVAISFSRGSSWPRDQTRVS